MSNQVVKVKRERIEACMTCPLCNKLFRDATTISECLHTFCRKCIYQKVSVEEIECCPVCDIYIGCDPLEKLKPDHNLQDVRCKIFPSRRRKLETPEAVPSVTTLPVRRKERSLSSLVVNTPKVLTRATTTGRRTKSVARKSVALQSSIFSIESLIKKEDDFVEQCPGNSSSPEILPELTDNKSPELLNSPVATEEAELWKGKDDRWNPLTCLVEVANRSKSYESNVQDTVVKLEQTDVTESERQLDNIKIKEYKCKSNIQDDKCSSSTFPESAKTKKLRRFRRKGSQTFWESGAPHQALLDAADGKLERTGPIWFALVASGHQEGDAPLPQIAASYLRIKDGRVPVNIVQKYLMTKLDLHSEDEVEIKFMGRPVSPTLQLCNLVDSWLQTTSTSRRVLASVGSSAKDYVMVLAYERKGSEP